MPILTLQRRQTEVGRIRLGTSKPAVSRAGKPFREPVKLDTFRFTTRSETLARQVADLYGGEPVLDQIHGDGARMWDVITEANALPVVVPPNSVSQWMEHWTGGICVRRCDGQREVIKDQPCQCDPDPRRRQCKPTTRIGLMLADIPGIGVWRLESHGFYAATELPAVAELLATIGGYVPARLEVEQREVLREKPNGGTELRQFMLPVLHVDAAPRTLLALGGGPERAAIEAAPEERPALPAGPEPVTEPATDPVQWEQRIDSAASLPVLREVWKAMAAAGAKTDELQRRFWARKAELDTAARAASSPPDQADTAEPDKDATWSQILRLGAERGWNTPTVSKLMRETVGHDPANADGWAFVQFRDAITAGQVTA